MAARQTRPGANKRIAPSIGTGEGPFGSTARVSDRKLLVVGLFIGPLLAILNLLYLELIYMIYGMRRHYALLRTVIHVLL